MNRYAARGQWLFLDLELYANTVRVAHEQGGAISPLSRSVGDFQPGFAQRRDEFAHRRDIHDETEMVDTVRLDHTGCKLGIAEYVNFLIADLEHRRALAIRALSPAQQLQPETLDIEAQAPIQVGNDETNVI